MDMTSNGKTLNYKIVDLIESYNFHRKLQFSYKVYLYPSSNKKIIIFLPPWGTAVGPCRRHSYRCIVLQNFLDHIFLKKRKEKCKKKSFHRTLVSEANTFRTHFISGNRTTYIQVRQCVSVAPRRRTGARRIVSGPRGAGSLSFPRRPCVGEAPWTAAGPARRARLTVAHCPPAPGPGDQRRPAGEGHQTRLCFH
jgi:hypothetical protein